jgi:hypothetical protein
MVATYVEEPIPFYDAVRLHETHEHLRSHLAKFVSVYNFAKRLKTLKGLMSSNS